MLTYDSPIVRTVTIIFHDLIPLYMQMNRIDFRSFHGSLKISTAQVFHFGNISFFEIIESSF